MGNFKKQGHAFNPILAIIFIKVKSPAKWQGIKYKLVKLSFFVSHGISNFI